MADGINPPLSYEPSATTTHPLVGPSLPPEVVACLKNARYVRPSSFREPGFQQLTEKNSCTSQHATA